MPQFMIHDSSSKVYTETYHRNILLNKFCDNNYRRSVTVLSNACSEIFTGEIGACFKKNETDEYFIIGIGSRRNRVATVSINSFPHLRILRFLISPPVCHVSNSNRNGHAIKESYPPFILQVLFNIERSYAFFFSCQLRR